ncbi:MAG: dTMP kinase [Rickettsiales bacterium]|jgi:dTMP kinase|nr:dTMP kinase [Rickettsiales bacterium]
MPDKKGYFIAFEGGEGVGKTTQMPLVGERLEKRGFDVVLTREPGGTALGNEIRSILLKGEVDKMSPMAEALLFTAARSQHVEKVIKPALAAGKLVISDRYAGTTYAYQGYAHGLGVERMEELYRFVFGDFAPDLTIVFDIPDGMAHGRLTEMNRMENFGGAWLKRGLDGFRDMARRYPGRCVLMDSVGTVPEVTGRIMKIIDEKMK